MRAMAGLLSLALVVLGRHADDPNLAMPLDDLALGAYFLDRRSNLHLSSAFFTIRPRPGSTGDTSTRTRSPGITRRNRSRAAGATCATILWPVSSSTR